MSLTSTRHMHTTAKIVTRFLTFVCLAIATLSAQQSAPSAPPKQVPGYVIGPNDVLRVTVYSSGVSQQDFRLTEYTVQTDGSIQLPLLTKAVVVGGKSVAEADAAIRKALLEAKQFDDCNVDIVVMGYHSSSIKIQGAVRNPGSVDMTADRMNISDALNKANGLLPSAGTQIRVKRAGNKPPEPDVRIENGWEIYTREDLDNGKLSDVQLFDNDTIDVPVAPKYFVQGFVVTPGESQWEPNLTLERALLKAGGVKPEGAKNRISITRFNVRTKENEELDYKKGRKDKDGMGFLIEANDVIYVPKKRML